MSKQTSLKDDPFYSMMLDLSLDSGFCVPRPTFFSPSCDSFMPLVHEDYFNIVATNRQFGKTVALSMYAYYNVIQLWARLFTIMDHRGELTDDENALIWLTHGDYIPVSKPVSIYLRGLGDFKDHYGTTHKMRVRKPNKNGDFGQISGKNHYLYEALPAPAYALERIRQDLAFTDDKVHDPIWEISRLRPQNASDARNLDQTPAQGPGAEGQPGNQHCHRDMPTANLLGWYPAVKLSLNQAQPIRNMMAEGDFFVKIPSIQYCPDIMRHVACNLQNLENHQPSSVLHKSSYGSVAQQAFLDIHHIPSSFNRAQYYSDGESSVKCTWNMDVRFVGAMRVFGLRIKRNTLDELNPWACYDFGCYKHVPSDWVNSRNNIFAEGLKLHTFHQFVSTIENRCGRRYNFLTKVGCK